MAIYLTFLEGEGGAEGYAAAVTRDQAKILWDTAKEMVERTPALRERFGVETARNSIYQARTASRFVAISSDAKALDGLNVHIAVCDEIGSHKTANVYEVLLTALGKRSQPLLLSVSTATGNNAGIGRKIHDYACKVLEGVITDERFFGVVYAADPADPIWAEATWAKANPGWGVTVQPDAIRAIANQAKSSPAQENAFKTRHLNLWVAADHNLFLLEAWKRGAEAITLDDFAGRECYIGLDLSTKIDIASAALLFPETGEDGVRRYALIVINWLPAETVAQSRNASYPGWARSGALTVTEGEVVDFDAIETALRDWCDRFDVRGIGFDPWQAKQLSQRMLNAGLPMREVRQTVQNMSEPTKEIDALIRSGRLRHDDNPVTTWSFSCVVGHRDEKDNVYPRKLKNSDDRIDPAVASIIALALAISPQEERTVSAQPFLVL